MNIFGIDHKYRSKIGWENCYFGLEKLGKWLGVLLGLKSENPKKDNQSYFKVIRF